MPLFGSVVLLGVGVLYPYADGLKELMMGSDQDDAIMLCGQALMRGEFPYSELSLTWVIHRVPLLACFLFFLLSIATGWYPLTTLIFLSLTIWIISPNRWNPDRGAIRRLSLVKPRLLVPVGSWLGPDCYGLVGSPDDQAERDGKNPKRCSTHRHP